MKVLFLVYFVSFLFLPITALCDSFSGKIVSVLDGDTIVLMTPEKEKVKVRLYGIDTPKGDQHHAQKAKRFTFSLVYDKVVEVIPYDTDMEGRTVGIVLVDNMNANEEVIRSGHGWQYRNYCDASFCSEWLQLENDAKISGVGLWHNSDPVPPWKWRKENQEEMSFASSGAI